MPPAPAPIHSVPSHVPTGFGVASGPAPSYAAAPAVPAPPPVMPFGAAPGPMPPQGLPFGAAPGYAPAAAPAFAQPPGPAAVPPAMGAYPAAAPPPFVQGALGRTGGPPMGAPTAVPSMGAIPPPLVSPGSLSGPAPAQVNAPSGRVLVGFLVTFQNDANGAFWAIRSGRTQMGRGNGEGLDVPLADASASSRHASVHADPATGQAFLEDDGSRNGTYLNEQRLTQGERRQLRDNDRLRLGSTTFVVKLLVS